MLQFSIFLCLLEEVDLDPNGDLFYAKLEEGNEGLGDRKTVIVENAGRSTRY